MASHASFRDQHLLVGRQREQDQLRSTLHRALQGQGRLVLVSGEAGIGKTTLVRWLVDQTHEHRALVLTGACYDLTTTPPYGPWREAIRSYQPSDGLPPIPSWFGNPKELQQIGSQTALFEAARRFFASIAEAQPLVIVLEDLHWADLASLEALRYLGRTLGEAAILLVVTYRDDEITRQHELYQLLPLLVREGQIERIYLNRLDQDDVRAMVANRYDLPEPDIARLVEHLSDRSEGNPFFAGEILQGLEEERVLQPVAGRWVLGALERARVPVLPRQALDTRLARLSPDTQAALRVAAVIGQIVPIDLWHELSGLDEGDFDRAMTEALDAHVLEEAATRGTVQFHHALFREAFYASLIMSQRRDWHRTVGEALAGTPQPDPDTVAHHFQEAGDQRAAHWLIRAGVRAEGSYALQLAASKHDRAQALLEADPDAAQARGWLLFHIGHLLLFADRERGLAYLEDAVHVARQVADPVLQAQSQAIHGLLRCSQGEVSKGLSEMESAIAVMDTVTPSQEQRAQQTIRSLFPSEIFSDPAASWGGTLFKVGRLPGVNTLIQAYVDWLARSGRFHKAMRVGESFIDQVTATTGDALTILNACRSAYFGLSVSAHWLGRPEEARRWRALALDGFEAIGHRAVVRFVRSEELDHVLTYETTQLVERRNSALATTAAIEGIAHHQLGGGSSVLLDVLEGRWDAAREFVQLTLEQQDPYAQYFRAWIYRVLGGEQRDEELIAAIQADIDNVLPGGPATEFGQTRVKNTVIARQVAAELALGAGDLDTAREWIEAHDGWLEWSGAVLGRAEGQLLWGAVPPGRWRLSSGTPACRASARVCLGAAPAAGADCRPSCAGTDRYGNQSV